MRAPIRVLGMLVIFLLFAGCTSEPMMGDDVKPPSTLTELTTTKIVWEGSTPIKDALTLSTSSKEAVLKTATETVLKDVKYPYNVSVPESKTEIKILKYKCDEKMGICGYWIAATRDGQEVYTNSPIWISPPPYKVVVSETYDSKLDETTITLKEDPKAAVEAILHRYVDGQPIGKAVAYER